MSVNFKRVFAQNFICFGPKGIEINFDNFGNIILIRGENLDVQPGQGSDKASSNGIGKCFGKNTPILMYDGTIKMVQDIQQGELVMGNDSTPRLVLNTVCGKEMLYKVVPKKGQPYIVNESHVLSLKSSDKKNGRPFNVSSENGIFNISIKNYLSLNKDALHLLRGWRTGVEFSKKDVRIDPYVLGVWLGDGTSSEPSITTADREIVKSLHTFATKRGLKVVCHRKLNNKAATYYISPSKQEIGILGRDLFLAYKLQQKGYKLEEIRQKVASRSMIYTIDHPPALITINRWIRKAKLWIKLGNKIPKYKKCLCDSTSSKETNNFRSDLRSYNLLNNKHIPQDYQVNDRKTRLAILAGLIDSDGSRCSGGYDFINKNKTLADDVVFLARSLGLAAYSKRSWKICKNNGKGNWYWRVIISGNTMIIPVRLKRKKSTPRKINKDPLIVGIKIEPIGEGEYFGFAVDGNHLFLLGDFTVVHNSSVQDILSYGLFGKCIKHPKKIKTDDVINKTIGKKMLIEVEWDDYKVIRGRKPNKLELWKGDKSLSQGHDETQSLIEAKLGFSFETFSNLLVFTDNNRDAFLELDTAGKRQIAENLLGLEEFKIYAEDSNNFKKSINNDIKIATKDYERLIIETNACKVRITKIEQQEKDWKISKENEINNLISKIKAKQEELKSSDIGLAMTHYDEAQEQIKLLQKEIPTKEEQINDANIALNKAQVGLDVARDDKHKIALELQSAESQIRDFKLEIAKQQRIIDPLEKNEGAMCVTCYGPIKKEHYGNVVRQAKNIIDATLPKIERTTKSINDLQTSISNKTVKISNLDNAISIVNQKRRDFSNTLDAIRKEINKLSAIQKPDASSKEKVIEEQIAQLKAQAIKVHAEFKGLSPFAVLSQSAKDELDSKSKECEIKKEEVVVIEELVPYYEFWEKGFGTKGIPKFAINGVIPTLNTQIAYWLQFLIQGTINLKLDGELEETIDRNPSDGDPYIYHIMSGGERRRLNLSVAAAFSKVMAIAAGSMPNVLFLDEVTTNVDPQGVVGIYRMITELSRDRKVFVTTHDQTLLEMLNGCDTLFLQKKDGFTTVVPQ